MKRILFVPDTHAPYHDKRAWDLMIQVARSFKPDIISCIGDLADFYSISSYVKDPARAYRIESELAVCNELLDELDSLKAKQKLFIAGNHEFRMDRYMQARAPELVPLVSVQQVLRLEERGWSYTPYREYTKIGKLHVTHDVNQSGKYSVHRALDTFQGNVVTGHTHRIGVVVEGNAKGERMVSAAFGWLGDVRKVDYMHKINALRNWSLGFGLGYLDEDTKNVFLTAIPIVKYEVVVEGKLYRG